MSKRSRRYAAPPRWGTPRTDRPTHGARLATIGAVLGTPFYDWQRQVADVGLEYDPDTGLLAYKQVIVTVPRQTGKTTLVFSWEVDRCIDPWWSQPQRVAYSAQTGWDARRKLIDDQAPMLEESPLVGFRKRILRGTGNESITFKTGSRIGLISGDKSAGHGQTLDLGVVDEAFSDVDSRREGAMVPAMKTRRNSQLVVVSTAGTDESIYLQRLVQLGRTAVENGTTEGIAYFEWSVPSDAEQEALGLPHLDVDDPEVWYRYIPAMNETAEAAIRAARASMSSESEWRRAFLNQWTTLETDRVIPAEQWEAICEAEAAPQGPLKLGLDVMPERRSAALVACGGGVAELVETFDGMVRVVERTKEISKRNRAPVVIDGGGPAASIGDDLEAYGVDVERLTAAQFAIACAKTFDAIADRTIVVRASSPLDTAAAAVRKRPQGDRFVWNRTSSAGDVTPLIALTLAFGGPERSVRPLIATS